MTRDEALEAYKSSSWKQEYYGSIVIAPTETVTLEVRFPDSFKKLSPPPDAVAFVDETHTVHNSETHRIKDSFSFSESVAKMEVRNPVIGLSYAISWMPP